MIIRCNFLFLNLRDPKLNGEQCKPTTKDIDTLFEMGVEGQRSPSASPEHVRVQRQGNREII